MNAVHLYWAYPDPPPTADSTANPVVNSPVLRPVAVVGLVDGVHCNPLEHRRRLFAAAVAVGRP